MSSILDHVEQAVPRATVYGAMKGSPVFIGKYFREIFPASTATEYNYANGERRINFIVASPDKTIFNDLRSAYLRLNIGIVSTDNGDNTRTGIAEPASNIIERMVIKMNGTVVEDISRFDHLTSFFKRSLLTRPQKNAREREGWAYYDSNGGAALAQGGNNGILAPIGSTGVRPVVAGQDIENLTLKLDLSGIFNCQQLLSGYYSPLEIDLYLQDPVICGCAYGDLATQNSSCRNYVVKKPRLCMEQIVMSPEYVSAFEAALLANSSAQGIQIPFTTYYTYRTNISTDDDTFWVRKPVRYLKGVYFGLIKTLTLTNGSNDCYRFTRARAADNTRQAAFALGVADGDQVNRWQLSVGTKTYREIDDSVAPLNFAQFNCNESQVMFAKAVGHYNDYSTESDEYVSQLKAINNAVQGIDLEFSPDNDVLASETTLNSNDVRLRIRSTNANLAARPYAAFVFLQYQASIALFPGNETRLLVT